ncbi:MAG: aminotransferase class I/II-fold pyridoxal phosphate-dependent enzyme [Deltaproteobacteria bacterium]|jgi:DNA-binding transcriptional MocR family regulator|nr:aminotransferase class I/II-fold pyridoxal phosphate-dependent enzyme [Deltaproteobacteria bacterium]
MTTKPAETLNDLSERYEAFQAMKLKLDMTRGKPAGEQLDLADGLFETVTSRDFKALDGTDSRNYGGLEGLPECRQLFADYFGVKPSEVLIGGNSSLQLMFDTLVRAHVFGVPGGDRPWSAYAHEGKKVRWLCPAPGYDRHFAITQHLGYELVIVPMTGRGPDMDVVERLVADDPTVKGIWIVPKYSNPTGESVSAENVKRLAEMRTAASDFRIIWDDAYAVHHLGDVHDEVPNLLDACQSAGNPNRVLVFGSTSKISHAGAGLAAMAANEANIAWTKQHAGKQTIGPDKVNQLRHVRFFKDLAGIHAHMQRHAAIMKPKFDAVLAVLEEELGGTGLATWTRPNGGYFISLDTHPGHAKNVVKLAAEAGVKLTEAGATFPYGKDPEDRNIRLAPSFPGLLEIEVATRVVATCVKLSAARG